MTGDTGSESKKGALFWIPMIWNGVSLFITLVVGITFLIGSRMPADIIPDLPGIIVVFFTMFDLLLVISPLTLIVMIIISIFNVTRARTKMERFLPLTFSAILQGMLSALFLASITQPAG